MDLEVGVALQIVRQEADAALQRHQLRAPGQVLLLCVRQRAGRALEKALGVNIKQRKVEIHLGKIALVLGGMVRAEADGIAEIIDGQARHHGVQVNDADALAGILVDEDVVEFGVVVRHAQGQPAGAQRLQRHAAIRRMGLYERDLRRAVLRAAQLVRSQRLFKIGEAVFSVVEFFNGLEQGIGGIILQHALEIAERLGGSIEQLRRFCFLQAQRIFHKGIHAPCAALAVGEICRAVFGAQHRHGFPRRVAAVFLNEIAQIVRHAHDVLHELVRVLECGGAHALEDVAHAVAFCRLGVYAERVVDMALAEARRAYDLARERIGGKHFGERVFSGICHAYTSHRLSGYRPCAVFSAMAATTTGLSSL